MTVKRANPCDLRQGEIAKRLEVLLSPTIRVDPTSSTTNDITISHKIQEPAYEFTLYLIRHGEASHNALEKIAKEQALKQALADGLHEDDDLTKERMEEARKSVLFDSSLFDAPLSDLGKEEAHKARDALDSLIAENSLPPPEEVLVSPLTRTLETANLIFPNHVNIHVRDELRERNTGKPPDTPSPANKLRSRNSFSKFSMNRLDHLCELEEQKLHQIEQEEEEDKAMLRVRTSQLFHLLAESPTKSVAVVTHKAYLRELERGPFENPSSPEYKNGEIRVYRVRFHPGNDFVDFARRIA